MQKLGDVMKVPHQRGNPAATPSEKPTPNSRPISPREEAAATAAGRLFDLLPPLDVGDPRAFIAATVAIFVEYPDDVTAKAIHVIAQRSDRPTLRIIRAVCEEIYAPIEREGERRAAHVSHIAGALPRPRRTPEQQARIDAQITEARIALAMAGIPPPARP